MIINVPLTSHLHSHHGTKWISSKVERLPVTWSPCPVSR